MLNPKLRVKSPDDFARQLDVRSLIFAHRHQQILIRRAVEDDVGGLQQRIAEESVGAEVAAFEVFDLLFVGGDALEPTERGDHREQHVQLGVLEDARLNEQCGFFGVEADGEPVDRDLQRIFGDGAGVFVMRGERVPVGDEIKTVVFVLQLDPIGERAEIMAQMKAAGWAACRSKRVSWCSR